MQVSSVSQAIPENRFHGFHGRLLCQPLLPRAQLARGHGPGNRRIGLSRAGLRLICRAATTATALSSPRIPIPIHAFTQARSGAPGLAYPMGNLLPITLQTPQSGRTFALNPYLTGVQNLFSAGRAAIIANTGTLVVPATKDQVNANSVTLPDSLFSHFDQTAAWQAISSNLGSGQHTGWGGAVADAIEAMNLNSNSIFTCISTSGNALFLAGNSSVQLNVTPAGPIPISGLTQPPFGAPAAANPLTSILSADETNLFAQEYEAVIQRSIQAQATLATAMPVAGTGGVANPPQYLDPVSMKLMDNPLASSLQTVARVIAGRGSLGVTRQIFYVQLGSFDTHNDQAQVHSQLLTQLGAALEYFDSLMVAHGRQRPGHCLHHLRLRPHPHLQQQRHRPRLGKPPFRAWRRGQRTEHVRPVSPWSARIRPTTSAQEGSFPPPQWSNTPARLASWFGLSDGQIREVFPNFGNFGSNPYLGFMG